MESGFRRDSVGGGIPNELTTTTAGDASTAIYFDGTDSALFTGTYLAAQCLKLATSHDAFDRETAIKTVRSLLDTAEIYAGVSGVPGLISRYVYRRGAKDFAYQEVGQNGKAAACAFQIPWVEGAKGYDEYRFCGATSRDQYHGFLLGLGVCQSQTSVPEVRNRAAKILLPIVDAIEANQWKIPYGPYQAVYGDSSVQEISSISRLGFAAMAMSAIPYQEQQATATGDTAEYDRLEKLKARLASALDDQYSRLPILSIIEQGWWNSYSEYYAYNLNSLALLAVAQSESDSARLATLKNYFWNQFWLHTWTHQNPQFSFIAQRILGLSYSAAVPKGKSAPQIGIAVAEARASLHDLLSRVHDSRDNGSAESPCVRDEFAGQTVTFIAALLKKVNIPDLAVELTRWGHIQKNKCKAVIPITERSYAHYYWEVNPFLQGSVASPTPPATQQMSPAVDAVFAYWLGRSVGAIQEGE